jgi:hypothetical protein
MEIFRPKVCEILNFENFLVIENSSKFFKNDFWKEYWLGHQFTLGPTAQATLVSLKEERVNHILLDESIA